MEMILPEELGKGRRKKQGLAFSWGTRMNVTQNRSRTIQVGYLSFQLEFTEWRNSSYPTFKDSKTTSCLHDFSSLHFTHWTIRKEKLSPSSATFCASLIDHIQIAVLPLQPDNSLGLFQTCPGHYWASWYRFIYADVHIFPLYLVSLDPISSRPTHLPNTHCLIPSDMRRMILGARHVAQKTNNPPQNKTNKTPKNVD